MSDAKINLGRELALATLVERAPLASSLAAAFKEKGYRLALVGGPVRDAILGRLGNDLDFTTDAHPLETKKILKSWAENVWDTGIEFGTIAGKRGDTTVEVTRVIGRFITLCTDPFIMAIANTAQGPLGTVLILSEASRSVTANNAGVNNMFLPAGVISPFN